MPALPRSPLPGSWLPSIIYVGLIVTMGIGLFGLTRLEAGQTGSTLAAQPAGK